MLHLTAERAKRPRHCQARDHDADHGQVRTVLMAAIRNSAETLLPCGSPLSPVFLFSILSINTNLSHRSPGRCKTNTLFARIQLIKPAPNLLTGTRAQLTAVSCMDGGLRLVPSPVRAVALACGTRVFVKCDELAQLVPSRTGPPQQHHQLAVNGVKARKLAALAALPDARFPRALVSHGGCQSNAMLALARLAVRRGATLRYFCPRPPKWLAELHAAYSVLSTHPHGSEPQAVMHYDFLKWLDAREGSTGGVGGAVGGAVGGGGVGAGVLHFLAQSASVCLPLASMVHFPVIQVKFDGGGGGVGAASTPPRSTPAAASPRPTRTRAARMSDLVSSFSRSASFEHRIWICQKKWSG